MIHDPKRIAIFRMGHLGDTIIALPAFWTVRRRFPNAWITYLVQEHGKGNLVQANDILRLGSVYDEKISYTLGSGGVSIMDVLRTLLRLRQKRIDTLIYIPPYRTERQLARDEKFFRLAGVRQIIGMQGFRETNYRPQGTPLPTVKHEADILLSHLSRDGVKVDVDPLTLMDMAFTDDERGFARTWLQSHTITSDRPIIGIGPGSKMLAKLWDIDRFIAVAQQLDKEYAPTFLIFGSKAEHEVCERVAQSVKHAVNVAGEFTVRESGAVFEHCDLYLGNDTGTMHIAAAAGVRCVALFSARDWPGRWYPYGTGHAVHRMFVPCEGCMLETCDKDNLCLKLIEVEPVVASARQILSSRRTRV